MSFELLQRAPEVTPLLVKLHDTHNVYALAENKGSAEACAELSTIMTDLLSIPLKEKESELIADVLLVLMKKAEADLRVALSERLSTMDNVPLRIILGLANDEIRVAEHVLRASPILQDMDLLYILNAQGITHGREIARRVGLGPFVINALADTKDAGIAANLSSNDTVTLTGHAFDVFSGLVETVPGLAETLSSRGDLPKQVATILIDFIGSELKNELTRRFGLEAMQAAASIDLVSSEINESEDAIGAERIESLLSFAVRQKETGALKIGSVIDTLRRGQKAVFLAQLCVLSNVPSARMKLIITEQSGHEFALLCRALSVSKADFVSVYLLTERFRGRVRKIVSHSELSRIMSMYDDIEMSSAHVFLTRQRA